MNVNKKFERFGLTRDDFFEIADKSKKTSRVIILRTGMEKIEKEMVGLFSIKGISTCPYGNKMAATVHASFKLPGMQLPIETTACAHPDNCLNSHTNFVEIAEKRCKYRLLLKATNLYEHNVFAWYESVDFQNKAVQIEKGKEAINEADKLLAKGKRN